MRKLNALIAGSTGYIGVQLIKLLVKHKKIDIKYLCGNSSVGKNIAFYDKLLLNKKLPKITKFKKKFLENVDLVFTALPNGEAQNISKFLLKKNSGRRDRLRPKIVEIGAILAIFEQFEVSKLTCHFSANFADRPRIYIEPPYEPNFPRDVCLNSWKSGG